MDNDLLVLALNIAKLDRPVEPASVTLERAVLIAGNIEMFIKRRKARIELGPRDEVYMWDEQKKQLAPLDTSHSKQST